MSPSYNYYRSGSGSGGSIQLYTYNLKGNGNISSNGGHSTNYSKILGG